MQTLHHSRIFECSIPSKKFRAIAAASPHQSVGIEEGNPVGKFCVVGVTRKDSAALKINVCDYMHGGFCLDVAQNPLGVSRDGKTARLSCFIFYFQYYKLNSRIQSHVKQNF